MSKNNSTQTRFMLGEADLPKFWYNIAGDSPLPPTPVLHPQTMEPVTPDFLSVLFPMDLILQEISSERYIEIPEDVREIYKLYRPTPLIRARRLEKLLGTPAHIYYKNEGVSPVGSHKLNTAIAQAYFNKIAGTRALTTETGAGQWGSSIAYAGQYFGLEVDVYMVKVSYQQKPYRRALMQTYGARCVASPSTETNSGRAVLADHPDSTGSLGIAISEAVEMAAGRDDTKYALGSVLNHVLLHQTIIGLEAMEQMDMAGDDPDIVIGCAGGGSNLAGLAFPYIGRNIREGKKTRIIAVEPASCPTLTRGTFAYDFGDTAMLTPLVKMYTLGSAFVPSPIHAGGLRYHGMAPLVSHCYQHGLMEARAYGQIECFEAGVTFAKAEGIVPAPESTHAVKCAIDEALKCKVSGESKTILFNLSGHGYFDMQAYTDYFDGKLKDEPYDEAMLAKSLAGLPNMAAE